MGKAPAAILILISELSRINKKNEIFVEKCDLDLI
jgi:hypothetical protein